MSYSKRDLDQLKDGIENVGCYSDVLNEMEQDIIDLTNDLEKLTEKFEDLEHDYEDLKYDYNESVKERLGLLEVIKTLKNELGIQ